MYTQKGARGTEVIPNIAFWKEFPFLIKVTSYMPTNVCFFTAAYTTVVLQDGMLFTISPCYKRDKYQGL